MKILGIDSSSKSISVAVCRDGKIEGDFFVNNKLTHSQTILPMIDNVLKISDNDIKDIDAFALTVGPGSFTGIRIGMSVIKGLAFASSKPCIPISTLEATAYSLADINAPICVAMDAKCNQVYRAIFKAENKKIIRATEDEPLSIKELKEEINQYETMVLAGDGADLCKKEMMEYTNVKVASQLNALCRASAVALLGERLLIEGGAVSPEALVPEYIRLPQAERERLQKASELDSNQYL